MKGEDSEQWSMHQTHVQLLYIYNLQSKDVKKAQEHYVKQNALRVHC